jgi:hypothetical protein
MFVIAFLRARHSQHDFADTSDEQFTIPGNKRPIIRTQGQEGTRVFGRPFVTAGGIVVLVAVLVAAVEITLLAVILTGNI